ncbi:substrate-binding periplasmic protein [Marinobacter zhejiangensis]|uniref:Amino acid ABC transporter substrate-binding protein, PAAT family n=1 Tax=Marinobacter zhejiangensis TaxID=488535 RepID=A0A1I4SVW6_9GAMM|nr:ABC transporter substrate-binding protein [Marinobacter zhejiangensis]SFM68433.1 amino acid ABC transporter substrate-binding protein, PAAT family [Marinobacter zhejiangensis]
MVILRRLTGILLLLTACGGSRADEPLTLLTFDIPPLVNEQEGRQASGYAYRVVERMFELAGDEFRLEFQPPKRALRSAMELPNTCAFPVDRSQERETSLSWIGPVSVSRHGLYSHPDRPHPIATLDDARQWSISSYLGSGVGEYLQTQGFDIHLASKPYLGLLMLQANRVDLWIADTRAAPLIARAQGIELNEPELVFFTTLRSMGCNTSIPQERLRKLERALLTLYRNGELADIIELAP